MAIHIQSICENIMRNKPQALEKDFLIAVLKNTDPDLLKLVRLTAQSVRLKTVGPMVYYRGLIEISNQCTKNCFYCGLRAENKNVTRYLMDIEDVKRAVDLAYQSRMGSLVIQSGELLSPEFYEYIEKVLLYIQKKYNDQLRITLCLGELPKEIYKRFYDLGARRYLLRIESSNPDLYYQLHPRNDRHSFEKRLQCLSWLKELNYQVGTGVMIGLPFQSMEHLADDLLFMKKFDIDMVGMGPYIEHDDTPLAHSDGEFYSHKERIELSYKMISLLRLLMPDINIAATTALQTLDPLGREKGVAYGANVVMPNLSDQKYRDKYFLYDGKPCVDDQPDECVDCLAARVKAYKYDVAYGEFGDSLHYQKRISQ